MYYAHINSKNILVEMDISLMIEDEFGSSAVKNIEVTEDVYNDYKQNPDKYIYQDDAIIINPNYEQQQIEKRKELFHKDFFVTSLGNIRRKVLTKTGEIKDFLTDLLPVISMAVSQGQTVKIMTYKTPDFTQDITDWDKLQEIKQATPQFIQECFNQISIEFIN